MRRASLAIKRTLDIVAGFFALILLSPLIALIAFLIKREDTGPVLFVQERAGRNGRPFRCYKFRSMVANAQETGHGIETGRDDPRITRIGAKLRHWRLDEIPQLLNVLRGDMSIVGPRATLLSQVARYDDYQRRRLSVRPGMAGWAFVNGANAVSWNRRIELDIWYVENWSLFLDAKILLKAVRVVLRREGLYDADGMVRDLDS